MAIVRRKPLNLSSGGLPGNSTRLLWAACVGVAVLGIVGTWWLLEPPCPSEITIATGTPSGQYFAFAQQYREILAEDGITLHVRPTAGSVENAELLRDEGASVDLAIMQGGAVESSAGERIRSLGGLYLEPLWVFYRDEQTTWNDLSRARGRRLAIGPEGSGTRALALALLQENKIAGPSDTTTKALPLAGQDAADALVRGDIDAVFMVISPRSSIVRQLLAQPDIRLMSFRRAEAYARKYPYLTTVTLHEGLLDLDANLPDGDVKLLAAGACLVAGEQLHPALVPLLLEAATRVHQRGGYLESPGEFPSPHRVDFPLAAEARKYFQRGPSVFYRYLPFRWAAWVDRVKMMLLPLVTLLFPLAKFFPPLYRWSIRSKIFRWYGALREIDQKMKHADDHVDFTADIEHLENLEVELAEVLVPLSYMEEFYNLRLHVAFVLERLRQRQTTPAAQRRAA